MATIAGRQHGMDEMARWLLFWRRWSLGRDIGMQAEIIIRV